MEEYNKRTFVVLFKYQNKRSFVIRGSAFFDRG